MCNEKSQHRLKKLIAPMLNTEHFVTQKHTLYFCCACA